MTEAQSQSVPRCLVGVALKQWFKHTSTRTCWASVGWCWDKQLLEPFLISIFLIAVSWVYKIQSNQNTCWSVCLILLHYLHEHCGLHGMKQTYSQMLVFIVHCYHIKADNFRHSQQERNNPYQSYFNCCPCWNPNAFDSIPGYDSSVSAKINGKMLRLGGLFVCNNDTFFS